MDVTLFVPCFIDQLYPATAQNTVRLLEHAGCRVHYNPEVTCCGQPAFNTGYWDEARRMASKFLTDTADTDYPIVSPSASCVGFARRQYARLFDGDNRLPQINALTARLFELSDFLVNHLHMTDFGASFPHKVTFHDSCSALREYGIHDEPRTLLSKVSGLTLVEMDEADTCCGFGGTFSVKNTAISSAMVEKKVLSALETGAEFIVSTEGSCLMNINGYCTRHALPIRGIHLADILANF